MTAMERLRASLLGERPDRIFVFCNLIDQGARELGVSVRDYYASGRLVAEGQLRMRARYGYDNLWALFYEGREAELLGCKNIEFSDEGPPNVADVVIRRLEDIDGLVVPDVPAHPAFQEPARCIAILRREAGGQFPIMAFVTSSMALASILMGMEPWMRLLLMGPFETRDRLLSKCSEFCRRLQAAYRAAGADLIYYAHPFCSTDLLPLKLIDQLAIPWMQRDLEAGTNDVVFSAAGAREVPAVSRVLDKVPVAACYLSPFDDIREAKQHIAGRALCVGVVNDIPLIRWSSEEIRSEVKRIMDAGRPGGRFAFGTGVMPWPIPEENIRIVLEAAYEFGATADAEHAGMDVDAPR